MADADPSQEELLAEHERLVAGDPGAPARLAELLMPALRKRFAGRAARRDTLDRDDIDSAIGNSIATYLAEPHRYDPERGPLLPYLYRDVDGDLRNEAARRFRHAEKPVGEEQFEIRDTGWNPTPEDEVVDRLDPLDLPRHLVEAALAEGERLSVTDREFLRLRGDGVRETQAFAEVLGIAHLPVDQQKREVKRAKDRLDKRLRSIRDRLDT